MKAQLKFQIALVFEIAFLSFTRVNAQNTFHNTGNLKVFPEAEIGFHTNLINDGSFDENLGLVGFYHGTSLHISGALSPVFHDLEIAVENDIFIETSIAISNSLNLIYGNLTGSRDREDVQVKLLENAFYNGEMDNAKVDGPVAIEGKQVFTFPIGYEDILRPLGIRFVNEPSFAKCEYFLENPNNPKSFENGFNTSNKDMTLTKITEKEFWDFKTTGLGQIKLTWSPRSTLSNFVSNLKNITVVGWNTDKQQWDNLGNTSFEGGWTKGSVTSDVLDTAMYEIYTLGGTFGSQANAPENYLLTPNGDGANDYLLLDSTERSPNNEIKIFNRYGILVFEKTDYKDEFQGLSNKKMIGKGEKLPSGIYYYIIKLKDLGTDHQGFFYLAN